MPDVSPHEADPEVERMLSRRGIPIALSMTTKLRVVGRVAGGSTVERRVVGIAAIASAIGIVAALLAQLLSSAIAFVTNFAFYGTFSLVEASPADNTLGPGVIVVPIVGAVVVGLMARYGSAAIRGHGIPEAMEQVLFNESRIPARVLFLKPLSAVISIGTGGPFGAEGPIIATGGALGSIVGQFAKISADERKTLLAGGAAAGMAATFGAPVAAVLLAMELLLFEYRPRSLIPVILATVAATGVRIGFDGMAPAFLIRDLPAPTSLALVGYVAVGAVAGVASVAITKAVYAVEDAFERIPIHWMWWPALGAVPVGVIGFFVPNTMGVGYDNIEQMISGDISGMALLVLCSCKLASWLLSLGSGTSGGTLAPLFIVGGGIGYGVAAVLAGVAPSIGIDLRIGALVGMAALFAGASRAPLACVVFAFEATRQPLGLLPLLGGCGAAYLLSCVMMRTSIMTEKIARRGRPIPTEYSADQLEQVLIRDVALRKVVTLKSSERIVDVQEWLGSGKPDTTHNGYPIVDESGRVVGVITQRNIYAARFVEQAIYGLITKPVIAITPFASLREAADTMLRESVGRLPVVDEGRLVGIVTRSDLLAGHERRLVAANRLERARGLSLKGRSPSVPAR